MCLTSTATSHPAIQPAMPPVLLSAALLDAVQAALPLPPADAPRLKGSNAPRAASSICLSLT